MSASIGPRISSIFSKRCGGVRSSAFQRYFKRRMLSEKLSRSIQNSLRACSASFFSSSAMFLPDTAASSGTCSAHTAKQVVLAAVIMIHHSLGNSMSGADIFHCHLVISRRGKFGNRCLQNFSLLFFWRSCCFILFLLCLVQLPCPFKAFLCYKHSDDFVDNRRCCNGSLNNLRTFRCRRAQN